jgi:hypothetical protein
MWHSSAVKGASARGDALPYAVGEVDGVVTPAGGGRVYGNLGDACFDDEQCQGDLRCLEGRCEIIDGVLPDGGFPDLDPARL